MDWQSQVVLITGGTGSFGRKFTENMLSKYRPKKLIILSRDELKQHEMRRLYPDTGDSPTAEPGPGDGAGGRRDQAVAQSQQQALAGAVRSQHHRSSAMAEGERGAIDQPLAGGVEAQPGHRQRQDGRDKRSVAVAIGRDRRLAVRGRRLDGRRVLPVLAVQAGHRRRR